MTSKSKSKNTEEVVDSTPENSTPVKPKRFLVVSKNENYQGKTFGLQFNEGRTLVDEALLPKHLNRSLEEVVQGFRGMEAYEVIPME